MKSTTKWGVGIVIAILLAVIVAQRFGQSNQKVKIEKIQDRPEVGGILTANSVGEVVPLDFTAIAKEVTDAVVHIRSTKQEPQARQAPGINPFRDFFQQRPPQERRPRTGSGSGVIINSDGYIVTNNHVVEGTDEIEVILNDNRNYTARIVGTDPTTDLALIRVKETDLPTIPLANSDSVEVGEWVLAVGNPFNLNSTVTAGIVSAKGRNINILEERYAVESFIQTDAAINPGNSGGALVNLQGGLVGINTAIASPTGSYSGYGFAVPANILSKVVEDLLEYGSVQRGYLGVTIRPLNGNLAEQLDLDITQGVYIQEVMDNSAAEKAGIQSGDVIIRINGNTINTAAQLQENIARRRPGDELRITVNRKGREETLTVELKGLDENKATALGGNVFDRLGAQFSDVNPDTARELDIRGGAKLTSLSDGILQRETRIQVGFIVTKVNGQTITSVTELQQELSEAEGGVMLEGVYEDMSGTYYYAFGMER